MMPTPALLLAAAMTIAAQGAGTAGSIVGCMADIIGQRLPGVAVIAKSGSVQRTTVADSSGCFELKDLPPGPYRVTARLPGFDNVTRDKVVVAPSTPTRFDVTMQIGRAHV